MSSFDVRRRLFQMRRQRSLGWGTHRLHREHWLILAR
jgi:hypothetical protein